MDNKLLKQGIAYFHAKNLVEARKIFVEIAKKYPGEETSWTWLAACAPTKEAAINCLKKAFEINPINSKTRNYLIQLDQKEFVQSLEAKSLLKSRLNIIENDPTNSKTTFPNENSQSTTINNNNPAVSPNQSYVQVDEQNLPQETNSTFKKFVEDDKLFKTIIIGFVVIVVLITAFILLPQYIGQKITSAPLPPSDKLYLEDPMQYLQVSEYMPSGFVLDEAQSYPYSGDNGNGYTVGYRDENVEKYHYFSPEIAVNLSLNRMDTVNDAKTYFLTLYDPSAFSDQGVQTAYDTTSLSSSSVDQIGGMVGSDSNNSAGIVGALYYLIFRKGNMVGLVIVSSFDYGIGPEKLFSLQRESALYYTQLLIRRLEDYPQKSQIINRAVQKYQITEIPKITLSGSDIGVTKSAPDYGNDISYTLLSAYQSDVFESQSADSSCNNYFNPSSTETTFIVTKFRIRNNSDNDEDLNFNGMFSMSFNGYYDVRQRNIYPRFGNIDILERSSSSVFLNPQQQATVEIYYCVPKGNYRYVIEASSSGSVQGCYEDPNKAQFLDCSSGVNDKDQAMFIISK
jgi:hypothetical protein